MRKDALERVLDDRVNVDVATRKMRRRVMRGVDGDGRVPGDVRIVRVRKRAIEPGDAVGRVDGNGLDARAGSGIGAVSCEVMASTGRGIAIVTRHGVRHGLVAWSAGVAGKDETGTALQCAL